MVRAIGGDLVGMSTALEAIAAREAGAEVLGISLVTNLAAGITGEPLNHAEVLAGRAGRPPSAWAPCSARSLGRISGPESRRQHSLAHARRRSGSDDRRPTGPRPAPT